VIDQLFQLANEAPLPPSPRRIDDGTLDRLKPFVGQRIGLRVGGSVDLKLAAVLEGKPSTDQVPLAAWLFVARSLENAVRVRRAVEGVEAIPRAAFLDAVKNAQAFARAAVEELPGQLQWSYRWPAASTSGATPSVRTTIRTLALLVVSSRMTTTERLSECLRAHAAALARCASSTAG
jgi:hypothetical protein